MIPTTEHRDWCGARQRVRRNPVVGALPVVVTFLVAQRAIVSGLTQGSVKG